MSLVEEIKNAIESYIQNLLPDYTKSQYVWDSSLNSDSKSRKFFSVKPLDANFIAGTCRTITVSQDFLVEIGDSFRNKKDTDNDTDIKIYSIYEAHETIYRALMRDNFGISRVQVVSNFSLASAVIDNENKNVKIEATFTIKYRTE